MVVDYIQLERFFNYVTGGFKSTHYLEIRLMGINNPEVYSQVAAFKRLNPSVVIRKNCQFFIRNFNELKMILEYENNYFIKTTKICYSISPKQFVDEDIGGGYTYIPETNLLFLDIERKDHEPLSAQDEIFISVYIKNITDYLEAKKGLKNPVIIHSGGGLHLLYKIKKSPIDKKRILGYKKIINQLEKIFQTPYYKIDHIIDLSRTIALPFTWNHKKEKMVTLLSPIPEDVELLKNDFLIKKYRKLKKEYKNTQMKKEDLPEIRKSLEYKLLTHPDLPKGDIHTYLLFTFKLLLKEHNITNDSDILIELEEEINEPRNSNHKLDLETGIYDKFYSPGTALNWVKKHKEWCDKNLK